uniref:RING-type domain-containing protein n=1 Tax=Romanomermis culicivorax TaxID=13658 RepID=A0A915KA34_ROMCU
MLDVRESLPPTRPDGRLFTTHEFWADKYSPLGFFGSNVCEVIYRRRRIFDKILDCYSNDPYRRTEIFDYVRSILSNADILLSEKLSVKTKFIRLIKNIAKVDIKSCVRLIDEHFANNLMSICAILGEEDRILYEILIELFDLRCSISASEVSSNSCLFSCNHAEDSELIKIFAGLICMYADDADGFGLLRFFSASQSLVNQGVLEICQVRRMNAAVIFLLFSLNCEEKAFDLLEKVLNLFCTTPYHQLFRSTPFCDLKPLIVIIFKEYRYEEIFLEALLNCIRSETRHLFKILENSISKRRTSLTRFCRLCDQILTSIGDYVILPCSHAFHYSCFKEKNSGRRLKNIYSRCPVCNGSVRFNENSLQQQASRNQQAPADEVETTCRKQVSFLMPRNESNQLSWKGCHQKSSFFLDVPVPYMAIARVLIDSKAILCTTIGSEQNDVASRMDTLDQLIKKSNVPYSYKDYIDNLAKERSKILENLNLPCGPKRI